MKTKRLFLFAGYNKNGCIDAALEHYVNALTDLGDIVLVMDSDCPDSELAKIQKQCVHTSAIRHGEYDFGSYKRAYIWATENLNLADYEHLYLVNDSVYGPFQDLEPYLTKMENLGHDAFGMVSNPHHSHPHIQSWFIGLKPNVFTSTWFDKFMRNITKLESKGEITQLYEQGLSALVTANKLSWGCLYVAPGRSIYNKIKKFYCAGMPFIKKVAFTRNHGALGKQIKYILNRTSPDIRNCILSAARATYGTQHIDWLLTNNPIKILFRNIHHVIYKLFIEGI